MARWWSRRCPLLFRDHISVPDESRIGAGGRQSLIAGGPAVVSLDPITAAKNFSRLHQGMALGAIWELLGQRPPIQSDWLALGPGSAIRTTVPAGIATRPRSARN